jgi:hypothetical protein
MSYCTNWRSAPEDVDGCCHQHDRDYGINGTVTRAQADRSLRECIAANGHPFIAWLVWVAVRCVGWLYYQTKDIA